MSKDCRESFVFYKSFQEAIDEVSDRDKLALYKAISSYSFDRVKPNLEGVAKIVWVLIKPQLDANWRKYEKGCKGGAPTGNTNASKKPKKQPENNLKQTNDNDNVNENVNVNVKVLETTITTTPSLSDIIEYVSQNSLDVDAHYFYDYYTSKGWMLGKARMADWRAALSIWDRKEKFEKTEQMSINPQIPQFDDL